MELTEDNYKLMAQYLQQTLSPDPNVRRPGKCWTKSLVRNLKFSKEARISLNNAIINNV